MNDQEQDCPDRRQLLKDAIDALPEHGRNLVQKYRRCIELCCRAGLLDGIEEFVSDVRVAFRIQGQEIAASGKVANNRSLGSF